MRSAKADRFGPGTSVLGGAASGLSYEGCLRDAVAAEERAVRRDAGQRRPVPAPQQQSGRRRGATETAAIEQQRSATPKTGLG